MIKREKTKQLLTNKILKILEQHGGLTCFELTYRMKFHEGDTTANYGTRRIVRCLLLLRKSDRVIVDKTTKLWSFRVAQTGGQIET